MKANLGLTDKDRQGALEILDATLADEFLLYTKTRNFHWNVTGSDFSELHKFFESQYEALDEIMDESAERARSLGGIALGSMEEFLKAARLKEAPAKALSAGKMLAALLADHEALVRSLRKDVDACAGSFHDAGTADFLTGLMERHEKMAWMLRSYLQ
jgi:starvation-inducible DNA-binding protein